jgi:outer membrane protein OmpA-like peptidoglycan-associated protein
MRVASRSFAAALGMAALLAVPVLAETADRNSGKPQDQYHPAIWIDPDGCQHWVMDDGQRGFMDPVRDLSGKPVCLRGARAKIDPVFPAPATADAWKPAIWIDPDGCQHWAMDEKGKGFMDLMLDRNGRPVCNRPARTCASFASDQLFATGSAAIGSAGRARLTEFFATRGRTSIQVEGHTDSRGSDGSNLALGKARARAVAGVAQAAGSKVVSVVSFGERKPKASNATAEGMAANRRVEITCVE